MTRVNTGQMTACTSETISEAVIYLSIFAAERPELRHAGPTSVNREAELRAPSRVACSDLLDHKVMLSIIRTSV